MTARVHYDPSFLLAGLRIAGIGFSILSGFQRAQQLEHQAEAEAAFLEAQAQQEAIQARRETRDLERERKQTLARTRAALAAQGGDLSAGSPLSIQRAQEREFGVGRERILSDTRVRQQSLRARAQNVRVAGELGARSAILGGFGTALRGGVSLLT